MAEAKGKRKGGKGRLKDGRAASFWNLRWARVTAVVAVVAVAGVWLGWPWWVEPTRDRGLGVESEAVERGPLMEPEAEMHARHAGSAACRECHAEAYAAWAGSHHGLAERAYREDLDRLAFDPPRSFDHGTQSTSVRLGEKGPEVETVGPGGERGVWPVDRVIGHSPLRQYLVDFGGGRWQTLEASWDPRSNVWFNVYGQEDRQPGEWGHWTGRGMNWNAMCGTCHNTRFRKHYDISLDEYRSTMVERTVGCESCHGPLQEHVSWQRAWGGQGKVDPTVPPVARSEHMVNCAACHARRSELTGDFVPGDPFGDHFLLSLVDEQPVYYPDGQVLEENFEFAAFLGSRMHAAGVTCLDCHDPHGAKPKLAGDALCMQCHGGQRADSPVIDPVRHTFHAPESTGSRCVNCHMPQTVYMQVHWRHDHGFTVPDPKLTLELGIPNACNRCHTDRDATWALEAAERWYGDRLEKPARARTRVLAKARAGEVAAVPGLLSILEGKETAYWQAAAAALLGEWVDRPEVVTALRRALGHASDLVRQRAVQSLAPRVDAGDQELARDMRKGLEDPVRAVRVLSAWALRAELDTGLPAGQELLHMLRLNADQPTGQAQLGAWELARGRPGLAVEHYQRAVAWDGGSAPLRQDLATTLSQLGRMEEALKEVQAAVALEPGVAEHRYRLGLVWSEVGRLDEALSALEEAVRLDPRHDRAQYNLGLAYDQAGRREEALNQLWQAETVNTRDARIPYARATILVQAGRWDEARSAVAVALSRDPGFAPALELERVLTGR